MSSSGDANGCILIWKEQMTHAEVVFIISWVIAPLVQIWKETSPKCKVTH